MHGGANALKPTLAEVQRSETGSEWNTIGEVVTDAAGRLRFAHRSVSPGHHYGYRLRADGVALGETWVDVPAAALALLGTRSNPAGPEGVVVRFTLLSAAPGWSSAGSA